MAFKRSVGRINPLPSPKPNLTFKETLKPPMALKTKKQIANKATTKIKTRKIRPMLELEPE